MPDAAEANRIAKRANSIAVIALVLSTIISLGALVVSILQTKYAQEENRQTIARQVVRDVDAYLPSDSGNKLVFRFVNRSPLPVHDVHVRTRTATGAGRNYRIGALEGCRSLGLYINRDVERVLEISFTDPNGQSWARDGVGTLSPLPSIDTTAETVPSVIDLSNVVAPSFNITELNGCS